MQEDKSHDLLDFSDDLKIKVEDHLMRIKQVNIPDNDPWNDWIIDIFC